MLALFLPPPAVINGSLMSQSKLPTIPPDVTAPTGARLSTGDAFPPTVLDDNGNDVGKSPLEAVAGTVDVSAQTPMFRFDANLAKSSAS